MKRYMQLARENGSTATTMRGALRWLESHPDIIASLYARKLPPVYPIGLTERECLEFKYARRRATELFLASRSARKAAGAETAKGLRSTRARVRMIAALEEKVQTAITYAERGCTERRIHAYDVIGAILTCAANRKTIYMTGGGVAKSYDYAYSTSSAYISYADGWVSCTIARDHSRNGSTRESQIRIPRRILDGVSLDGILPGEVCTIVSGGVRRRYSQDGSFAGVAVPMPAHLVRRFGAWEHGMTTTVCRAEIDRKQAIVDAEIAQREASERERRRMERRAALVARLCHGALVSASDVRAVGACNAGIMAWCQSRGVDPNATLPLPQLAADQAAARYALMIARAIKRSA